MSYRFAYQPTRGELAKRDRLFRTVVYSGWWSMAQTIVFCVLFLGLITSAFISSIFILLVVHKPTFQFGTAGPYYYLLSLAIFAFHVVVLIRFRARAMNVEHQCPFYEDCFATVSEAGVLLENHRSQSFRAWPDIIQLVEDRGLLLAMAGDENFIFSDRMLSTAGNPSKVKSDVKQWYETALLEK